jgi:hypothetical protein
MGLQITNPPSGKDLAVRSAELRMADMESASQVPHTTRDPTRSLLSLTAPLTAAPSPIHPCPLGTTTGGAIEAGNETTETKIGTGIETETGTGTVLRAAGAAALAARNGAPTRDVQVCTINLRYSLRTGRSTQPQHR